MKKISPSARKIAAEKNVDLSNIEGSGKNGLIIKEDILNLMSVKQKPSQRKISHGPEEN